MSHRWHWGRCPGEIAGRWAPRVPTQSTSCMTETTRRPVPDRDSEPESLSAVDRATTRSSLYRRSGPRRSSSGRSFRLRLPRLDRRGLPFRPASSFQLERSRSVSASVHTGTSSSGPNRLSPRMMPTSSLNGRDDDPAFRPERTSSSAIRTRSGTWLLTILTGRQRSASGSSASSLTSHQAGSSVGGTDRRADTRFVCDWENAV